MIDVVRPEVRSLVPYNAGLTAKDIAQGDRPARIAKLSSNENPLGPSPLVHRALRDIEDLAQYYPDSAGRDLKASLAAMLRLTADRLILGNGSEDLISVICRTVLRPGDTVVTPYPSFQLHEDYATLVGAAVRRVPVKGDFTIDTAALSAAAQGARVLFLSNPMNPTGSWLDEEALASLARDLPADCLLVLDEAYFEYAAGPGYANGLSMLEGTTKPWIVLRTFSKAYGLAGLRVGYGVASNADLRDMMDRVRTPFNVNSLAQTAALAALSDQEYVDKIVRLTMRERETLADILTGQGYAAPPSRGNFLFVDCGGPSARFAAAFLREGVIVKPWKQAGFEHFVRISAGGPADTRQFAAAMPRVRAALDFN